MEITSTALAEIRKMLDPKNASLGIRIYVQPSCCTPKVRFAAAEKAGENIKTVSIDGIDFFIDKLTEELISGYIIDFNSNGFKLDYMLPQGRCCR